MRINRVYLENYRVHEKLEIEFSKGINLLLGENGKGKSSILEAIGYALFDSGLRTNNQKEAIKYGKKSAKIEIDFLGIDNNEYKVVRRIPGGTQLFRGDKVLEGRVERIKELCGIKGDIKDVYDNVIVAKQNEFILAFKERAADREKIFNRVFNTDIYTKIYEGYSREVSTEYEKELALAENSVINISEGLFDSKEIEEKIDFLEENFKIQNDYERVLEKKALEIKMELEEIRSLESSISELEIMKRNSLQNLENQQDKKNETKLLIDESIKANEIVEENRAKYESYQIISQQITKIKDRKKEIEKEKEIYLERERRKINLEYELSQLFAEKEVLSTKEEGLKKFFNEKEQMEKKLLHEKSLKEVEAEQYKKKLEEVQRVLTYSLDMEEKLIKAVQTLDRQKEKIFEKNEELKKIIEEKNNLDGKNIYLKLQEIEQYEKNLKDLDGENKILYTQKKESEEALKMLKSTMCPYLEEECQNLKGRDVSEFFNEKIEIIIKKIEKNSQEIVKLENLLKNKEKLRSEIYKYEELSTVIAEKKNELENEKLRLENWDMRYQLREREYSDYKKNENFLGSEELKNLQIIYKTKLNGLEIEKYEVEIRNSQKEKEEIAKIIRELILDIQKIDEKILEIKEKIKQIVEELEKNKDIEKKFKNIIIELEENEEKVINLEKAKELYIENYKKALEKDRYVESFQKIEENLKLENENIKKIEGSLVLKKEKLFTYDKENLNNEEKKLDEEFKALKTKLGGIEIEISYQKEKLSEIKEKEKRLKEEKEKIEKLKLKVYLTKNFREKIKNMGKEVAKNILKEIELIATENFRKITGRGEKINWSNEDKDKYSVYLLGDKGELKFEQLSGGEQVAIAIAIRGAMSEIFTNSKFSIFDEPTNNLDRERRKYLADSIAEILKNLDQSIIVTHDDTFREMAEKVIEL
ncbi:AAA family ATPase [Fusobacterium necrogenes]|uniref:AAA family ATPase n=1 Tax=Fusobacterium necrogenes TaxID=858 RepID=UPI00255C44BC|nr:SMC family ATPase [Fusobacterium necrogenes]